MTLSSLKTTKKEESSKFSKLNIIYKCFYLETCKISYFYLYLQY